MASDYLSEATRILNEYKDTDIAGRPSYLHPYTLLTALLAHAPNQAGRQEIAKDIVNSAENDLSGLVQLTDYFWSALLVPCTILYFTFRVNWSESARWKDSSSVRTPVPRGRVHSNSVL